MSTSALLMMVLAIVIIWGGLALAIINLRRSTDLPEQAEIHRDL